MTTIKQSFASKQNQYKWAVAGIVKGSLFKVEGYSDLDSYNKTLISIYAAQIQKAAETAGIHLEVQELAQDFVNRLKEKIAQNAEMDRKTLADSVYGIDSEAVY